MNAPFSVELVALTPDHPSFSCPPLFDTRRQALFCESLSAHGNVRLACKAAGVSPQTAYRMRRSAPAFRQMWDAALVLARAAVEEVLADRAINGVEEQVFYHGEEVARRRRYDSRLLLAHLARLDRKAEAADCAALTEQFDEALAALEAGVALPVAAAEVAPDVAPADGPDLGDDLADDDWANDWDEDDVSLLEAQLRWIEAHYGTVSEEVENFHLLNTVPSVPASELALFGWRGETG
jgi:hypothetical protein